MIESTSDAALAAARNLHQQGRLQEAIQRYKQLLKKPHVDGKQVFHLLGIAQQQMGDIDAATRTFQKGLMQTPLYSPLLLCLGTLYIEQKNFAQAETLFRNATVKHPTYGEAWYLLGALHLEQHQYAPAAAALQNAVKFLPNDLRAWNNLGSALQQMQQFTSALEAFQRALQIDDKLFSLWMNLALTLRELHRFDEAVAAYERMLSMHPNPDAGLWHDFASLLKDAGRISEAQQHYRKAIELAPDNLAYRRHLAIAQEATQRYEDAARTIAEAIDAVGDLGQPVPIELLSFATSLAMNLCDWAGAARHGDTLRARIRAGESRDLNPLLALPDISAQDQLTMARAYARHECGPLLELPPLCTSRRETPGRLRIGYLSSDWHSHATAVLLTGVLEQHDRGNFEIFGYSIGTTDASALGRRFIAAVDHFHDLTMCSDRDAAERILADGIDILVDLKGYTDGARPNILALRPAPVQVSWLGYPGTLGERRLADFIIGDAIVTPLERQEDFAETIVQLPHCYQPNDDKRPIPDTPPRAALGLPDTALVLCNFNQGFKITPDVFAVWCDALAALPAAVLWQLEPPAAARRNLIAAATARGIAEERLIFAPKVPVDQHLARLRCADLALDTSPYTSHTTAADALWAGVPLVSLQGGTFAARVAASILRTSGLGELVTTSLDAYRRMIIELGGDRERLNGYRRQLEQGRGDNPLFATAAFTRDLEAAYLGMIESGA